MSPLAAAFLVVAWTLSFGLAFYTIFDAIEQERLEQAYVVVNGAPGTVICRGSEFGDGRGKSFLTSHTAVIGMNGIAKINVERRRDRVRVKI